MKNEKFQENLINDIATYVVPVAMLMAIVTVMIVLAYLCGRDGGTCLGVLVACLEVIGAGASIKFVSKHNDENNDAHTIK